jgi:hypothetical protein
MSIFFWRRLYVTCCLSVASLLAGCTAQHDSQPVRPKPEEFDAAMLSKLPPWRASRDLTDDEWDYVIFVAQQAQRCDPADVVKVLQNASTRRPDPEQMLMDYEDSSHLMLLMRVIFQLPEAVPTQLVPGTRGYIRDRYSLSGKTYLSWPVSWPQGQSRPRLVQRYKGGMGPPYSAVDEYCYFLEHYSYRPLPGSLRTE